MMNPDQAAGWRILRGVIQKVEQHLLEQYGIKLQHRHIGLQFQFDTMFHQDLACPPERAADHFAKIVRRRVWHNRAGFELGHVEKVGDEPVETFGFVDDRRQQIALLRIGQPVRQVTQGACRPEHRR